MINFSRFFTVLFVLLLIFVISNNTVFAFSYGPPDEKTGAPNEGDCTDCHTGNTLNATGGSLVLTVPTVYIPGEEYDIVVDLMRTGQSRWGFEMTALNSNNARAGTFATVDANTQTSVMNSKQYIKQTSAGSAQGTVNKQQWKFKWTAPTTDVGTITFYAAGNAANNAQFTLGDYIYTETSTSNAAFYGVSLAGVGALTKSTSDAGSGVNYTLRVTNNGNITDTIDLETSGDVTPTLSQSSVQLNAGASTNITLTLPGTALETAGDYEVKVKATSQGDNSKTDEITTSTTILPVYDVAVTGVGSLEKTTNADTGASYTLRITNNGNIRDTISLATSGDADGTLSSSSVTLAPEASSTVTLSVSGDALAKAGDYEVKVTVTSQGDDTVTDEVTTMTTISPVYGFTLEGVGELTTETSDASEGISYTLKLTNSGNTDDVIDLATAGTSASLSQTEVSLAYGASAEVTLTISGDDLAEAGDYEVKVTATSQGDDTITQEIGTTTTILPVYGFTLSSVGELTTETSDASEGVSYTLKLTNSGNTDDVIDLVTEGTPASLSQTEVVLAYGASAEVTLMISGDDLAEAGDYEVKVTATSQGDDTVTQALTTTTTVLPVYGVKLESKSPLTGSTQDSVTGVTYTLTVTNIGNTEDTIILGSSAEVGIGGSVLGVFKLTEDQEIPTGQLEITLEPGASIDVLFMASGDLLTRSGEYEIKVNATSKGDGTKSAEVTTMTTILPVYGVKLESKSLLTGSTQDSVTGVTYTLTVTNTGNTEDTIILGSSAEVGIGGAVLGAFKSSVEQEIPTVQLELTLDAGTSADVLFIASGDLLTRPDVYAITVTATSKGDGTKSAEVATTTTILTAPPVYGVTLVSEGELAGETEDAKAGVTYTLTVTNTGNTNDTINLSSSAEVGIEGSVLGTFKLTEDQETATNSLDIELAEGGSRDVLFTVAGGSLTVSGEYEVSVTATSKSDSTKTAEVTTTTILPVYDVTLVGKGDVTTETADAGDWIRYMFTVKNTGNTPDVIDLTAEAEVPVEIRVESITEIVDGVKQTLVIDYLAPDVATANSQTEVSLSVGATAEIALYVFGEVLKTAGDYEVNVVATSQGDKTKSAEVLTTTTITPVYRVKLQGKDELMAETMDPLKGVSYVLIVTNEGNTEDTFLLGSSEEVGIEGTVLGLFTASDDQEIPTSRIEVTLAPGASTEVTFTAAGDFFTKPGEFEIVVTATSKSDDTKIAEIRTKTTITPVPWDLNADGTVNILDLVLVSNQFGESGGGLAGDVNMDDTVNILDLVQVASYFGKSHVEIVQENQ